MSAAYVLSKSAAADLRAIVRYTQKRWGPDQVVTYVRQLQNGIERLACGGSDSKDLSELYPGLRMLHCQSHYIFCLPRDHGPALIVAIFHERMDLIARVASRLL